MEGINFKIAGRKLGESIILEWTDNNNQKQVGFIDCALGLNRSNYALRYLIDNRIKEIDFIILSHPHSDRFSGLMSLLKYCEQNKVRIKKFIHTMMVNPEYLFEQNKNSNFKFDNIKTSRSELIYLIDYIIFLGNKSKTIQNIETGVKGYRLNLNNDYHIDFLSPSDSELREYVSKRKNYSRTDENLLSSVLAIRNKTSQVLLFADATIKTIRRLFNNTEIFRLKTLLSTLPQKGSKYSFEIDLWEKLFKIHKPIIVGVEVNRYSKPSSYVIDYFSHNTEVYTINDYHISKPFHITDLEFENLKNSNIVKKDFLAFQFKNEKILNITLDDDGITPSS